MNEDTALVLDLIKTSATDALTLIVGRAQLVDNAGSQLAIITGATALLAGSIQAAILDQDTEQGDASTRVLWKRTIASARKCPLLSVEVTAKAVH